VGNQRRRARLGLVVIIFRFYRHLPGIVGGRLGRFPSSSPF